jgi:hypothetical protein
MPEDLDEEAVDAEWADPADTGAFYLPKVFEIRIGVSYFTSEKLFEALVVIYKIKL